MFFRPLGAALVLALTLVAGPLVAENPPASEVGQPDASMPAATLKKLRRNPAGYIAEAAEVIARYGAKGAIGRDGIDRMIALDRARARASEVEKFLRADLDADGAVAQAEFAALVALSGGARKVALGKAWTRADADASGTVDPAELAAHAAAVALDRVSEAEAEGWRALPAFDRDGDGRADVREVIAGVAALQRAASGDADAPDGAAPPAPDGA